MNTIADFCENKSLVAGNFDIIPLKNFFDSFSEEEQSPHIARRVLPSSVASTLSQSSSPACSTITPTASITITMTPSMSLAATPSARLIPGSSSTLSPTGSLAVISTDSFKTLGDLVDKGYTTILLQEKKALARRKLLKKTDRITTGLGDKMTTDVQAETDEVKQIEATLEGQLLSAGSVKFKKKRIFGGELERSCEGGGPSTFLVEAFQRLIADADSKKFSSISVFPHHFEEVATLEVSKEALEQSRITLATLPSSRTIASLTLLFLKQLDESLIDHGTYVQLLEAKDCKCETWRLSTFHSILLQLPECNRSTLKFITESIVELSGKDTATSAADSLSHLIRCFAPVICPVDYETPREGKESRSPMKASGGEKSPKMKQKSKTLGTSAMQANSASSAASLAEASKVIKIIFVNHKYLFDLDLPNMSFVMASGRPIMSEATYEAIIDKLTDGFYKDDDFENIIFSTHTYFKTSSELLQSLRDVYDSHVDSEQPSHQTRRLSVLSVVKHWVQHWPDMLMYDEPYTKQLLQFSRHVKGTTDLERQEVEALNEVINNQVKNNILRKQSRMVAHDYLDRVASAETSEVDGEKIFFAPSLKSNVATAAQQFAQLDSFLFKNIELYEILKNAWQDPTKSQNFAAITEQTNGLGAWVQFWLLHSDLAERVQRLAFFISLACHSLKLGNYSCAFTVYTALNAIPINRLKATWAGIRKTSAEKNFSLLQQMFDLNGNYSNYRTHLANAKRPAIPYLGIITKDLFSLEENPTTTSKQLINLYKLRLVYGHIRDIKYFQQVPFEFSGTPMSESHKRKLQEGPGLDREELYQLSLKVEPKATAK
eukprot:TRINITY_DN2947_c0_g1_i5.p1 TRINITY_DN2947_c0_g1~~TRINITY_DN2947_c0_g1_i5.p1  ORF type:complete len:967 (+),score=148.34 TRINITY_DN2947_c0_g1_i5:407-2902(+)